LGTSETIDQHLQALEELLLQPGTRRNAEQVAGLLSDDFVEFGSSGAVFDKTSIFQRLAGRRQPNAASSTSKHRRLPKGSSWLPTVQFDGLEQPRRLSKRSAALSGSASMANGRWHFIKAP